MKKIHVAALAALTHAGILFGQTPETSGTTASTADWEENDPVVITVTKNAQVATKLGSAFTRIDNGEIERTQAVDLPSILNSSPGVVVTSAGARGGAPTVSIRGSSHGGDTLFLLDGVRLNTGVNQDAKPFMAYAGADSLQSIEIVRGPQSTLYGSESIGGVIAMETKKGEGKPGGSIFGEIGTFNSLREGIRSGGEIGKGAYSVSYERDDTDNLRPHNTFSVNRYALRLDYQALDNLDLRLNFRGHVAEFQEPGPLSMGAENPTSYSNNTGESNLLSLMANWRVTQQWTQKFTLGAYFERYTNRYLSPFWQSFNNTSNAANYTADWQNVVQITRNNRLTAGFDFYHSTANDSTFSDKRATNWALYLQDEWEPVRNFNLTGGIRYDHYDLTNDATTYRFTGAYLIEKTDTKLRASVGTAFKAPDLIKLFSTNPGYLGNPDLKPETSIGWDAGIDQYLFERRVVLGATYFRNNIRDRMAWGRTNPNDPNPWAPWEGKYANQDKSANDGVELSVQAKLFGTWRTRLAYTWTESTDSTPAGTQRVDNIPRHLVTFDTNNLFFGKWLVGCGFTYVIGRQATDWPPPTYSETKVPLGNYCVVRAYTRYNVNDHLSLFARVENLTDQRYDTRINYPGLPIGFYGGAEFKF